MGRFSGAGKPGRREAGTRPALARIGTAPAGDTCPISSLVMKKEWSDEAGHRRSLFSAGENLVAYS